MLLTAFALVGCPAPTRVNPGDANSTSDPATGSLDGGSNGLGEGGTPSDLDAGLVDAASAVDAGATNTDAGVPADDAGSPAGDAGTQIVDADAGATQADGGGSSVDAGPQVPQCAGANDCPAADEECVFQSGADVTSDPLAICAVPAGGDLPVGAPCTQNAACLNGLCRENLCASLCDNEDDCGLNQTCSLALVSVDSGQSSNQQVCRPDTNLPLTHCSNDGECTGSGRVCSDLLDLGDGSGNLGFYCAQPPIGLGLLGAPCSGASLPNRDQCASGLCDDVDLGEGVCTTSCTADADCDAMTNGICTGSGLSNLLTLAGQPARICEQACEREADCDTGRSCKLRTDAVDDRTELACGGHHGPLVAGTYTMDAAQCQTSLRYNNGQAQGPYCSTFCVDSTDCPTGMECGTTSVPKPSGNGSDVVNLCKYP